MFFEGRITKSRKFDNVSSLVETIKESFNHDTIYYCIIEDKVMGLANDQSNCEGILEAAILNLSDGFQMESLTLDWIQLKDWEAKIKDCFRSTFTKAIPFYYDHESQKIKSHQQTPLSWFTCGCCGIDFKSSFKYQQKFDQEAGYGICPNCSETE